MNKIDQIVARINRLMIRQRRPFIEQYVDKNGNAKWHHRDTTLTDNILRDHFEAKRTIGVFYAKGGTPFLIFDIDAKGDSFGQEVRVKGITTALVQVGISLSISTSCSAETRASMFNCSSMISYRSIASRLLAVPSLTS